MPFTIEIDETVHVPVMGSLSIQKRLNACNRASFELQLLPGETEPVEVGQGVLIYGEAVFLNDDDGEFILDSDGERIVTGVTDTIYGGTVQRLRIVDQVASHDAKAKDEYTRRLRVDCLCNTHIAERFHAVESYSDMTAGDIATDLVDTYLAADGVTTNNVQTGLTIDEARFNYQRVSEALTEIAELTGFAWYIDADKDLNFFDRSTTLAPIEITDSNRPYQSLSIETSRGEYRNRQYVRAGRDTTAERTESFVGDGTRQTFTLSFPVAKKPTVKVNGTTKTVGIQGIETGTDWFWNKGSREISQDQSGTPLTTSDTLAVTYQGLFPIIVLAEDSDGISERKSVEGGTGVYEGVVQDANIDDSAVALEKGLALLRRFGDLDPDLTLTTDETGLAPGQLLTVNLTSQDLDASFQLQSVSIRDRGDAELRSRVEAVSGEAHGGWVDFFRKLRQSGEEFVIRENEILVLLRTPFDNMTWTDTTSVSEDGTPGFVIGVDEVGFAEVA